MVRASKIESELPLESLQPTQPGSVAPYFIMG
jgi:hypothetical protein